MEFCGVTELIATREGDTLILRPARPSWEGLAELPPLGGDFSVRRPDGIEPGRVDPTADEE